jgi:hypothetical protein
MLQEASHLVLALAKRQVRNTRQILLPTGPHPLDPLPPFQPRPPFAGPQAALTLLRQVG